MHRRSLAPHRHRSSSRCSPERAASTPTTRARTAQIAEGIKVNGVDVGGMSAAQARTKLRAALLEPLNRPVTARYEGKRYTLTPQQAQIGVDIDGSVAARADRARARATSFSRTWREVRGEPITHRPRREGHLLAGRRSAASSTRVERDARRRARRAPSVDLENGSVAPDAVARTACAVRAARLRRDLERELLDAGERRARARPHRGRQAQGHHRGPRGRSIRRSWSSTAARSS